MPKLPDAMDLGALPSARSGRGVATYDTTAIGRGQEALGSSIMSGAQVEGAATQQLANAGFKAATVGLDYVQDQEKKAAELNDAKAYADLQVRNAQVDKARDDESDPAVLKDYKNNYQNALDMSASVITDPQRQELFKAKHSPIVEAGSIAASNRAFNVEKDASRADTMRQLSDLQDAGLKTTDETKKMVIVKSGQNLINKLEEAEYITAVEAEKMRKDWVQGYAVKAVSAMRPEDRINLLREAPQGRDAVLDRIGGVESGGDPNARASTSSALGTFQFTKGTWADMIAANRPDLAKGRSTAELTNDPLIQNLRTDPKLSREMAGALLDRNAAQLKSAGIDATPGNLYLAHFLGPGDAVKVLKAAPGTPVTSVVNADSIDANQSVLAGKTVDTVTNWANRKMGGTGPKDAAGVHGFIPEALKPQIVDQAYKDMHADDVDAQRALKAQADQAKAVSDQVEGGILKDIYSEKPTMTVRDIVNNPQLTREAKERMITRAQSALAEDKTDKTYGKGFFDAYQKVHAADGTEGKITDPGQLYARVGPNGPNDLTVAGVDKLKAEIEARRSPEGVAEGEMKKQFLSTAKGMISGSDEGLHIKDPKGDQLYLKWLAQALPAYDAAKKAGKTPAQLLNPDSPDYIGKSIDQFKRPMDQWFGDVVQGAGTAASATPAAFDVGKVKSLDDLVGAYRSGQVSKATADQLAIDRGWATRRTSSAQVPVSSDNSTSGGNLLDQARAQYPILKKQDYGYVENFKPNSGYLEHWEPGEPGAPATAANPLDGMRPKELPLDQHGLEIRDPKTRPIDILGDIVSHNLVHNDPVVKAAYEKLEGSLNSKQQEILRGQYEHAQKQDGETRSFEDWKNASGMPAFFRGYTFKQWPKDFTDRAYTPAQRADLDRLMVYLQGGAK